MFVTVSDLLVSFYSIYRLKNTIPDDQENAGVHSIAGISEHLMHTWIVWLVKKSCCAHHTLDLGTLERSWCAQDSVHLDCLQVKKTCAQNFLNRDSPEVVACTGCDRERLACTAYSGSRPFRSHGVHRIWCSSQEGRVVHVAWCLH